MSLPEPPIWLRVVLLVFATGSFIPQVLRICTKRTTNGVSSPFILCNLILATEKLTMYIMLSGILTEDKPDGSILLHSPPSAGDTFSLWHCAVVTTLCLIPFAQILLYSNSRTKIILLIASYTGFLLISIVPLVCDSIWPINDEDRRYGLFILWVGHSMYLCPILTILGIWGFYRQAREIYAVPFPNALSLHGLAAQATVFTFLSVTWIFCLPFPYEKVNIRRDLNWVFTSWFQSIGYIIVDNLVFAVGQAILLLLALRRSSSNEASVQLRGETEPLLGQHPLEEE